MLGSVALLRPLWKPLKRHLLLLGSTIAFGWAKFLLPLVVPLLLQRFIDNTLLSEAPRAERLQEVYLLSLIGLGAAVAIFIASFGRSACGQTLSAHVQHHLRRRLFNHLQRLSMRFFQKHHAGALGARVSSDIQHAAVVIDKGVVQISMDLVTIGFIGIYMVGTNAPLTLLSALVLMWSGVLVAWFGPRLRRQRKEVHEGQSQITGHAAEIFAGITLVRASAGEQVSDQDFSHKSWALCGLQRRVSRLMGMFHGANLGLVTIAQVAVFAVGAWMCIRWPDMLTAGQLVAFTMLLRYIDGSIQRFVDNILQLQDGMAALERIQDMLRVQPDPIERADARTPRLSGSIALHEVTFGYEPDRPILRDLSLAFTAGRSYALVGPSGGGKSTICQLLLRFYDPDRGAVELDGVNLQEVQQEHFRRHVAVVLQDPILFSSTIADNISFALPGATREDVIRAAKAAQAHAFISALPRGYDTPLGERGVNLSGGQRQRIAVARALMRDPKILILDEATSALDSVTERSIQDVIDHLKGSRTIIIIAHRLSTIRNVDEIVVMEKGRALERGSYDELVAADRTFAHLVREQDLASHCA